MFLVDYTLTGAGSLPLDYNSNHILFTSSIPYNVYKCIYRSGFSTLITKRAKWLQTSISVGFR
jgi:hypothetical protein